MLSVNEHILKISNAGVSLPEALELSHRYHISLEADIVDVTDRDNQDGTINRIYKAKPSGNIDLLEEKGRIIKAKDKPSVSRSVHGAIWHYHNQNGIMENFDDYYYRTGKKMAAYMNEIIEFLNTKS